MLSDKRPDEAVDTLRELELFRATIHRLTGFSDEQQSQHGIRVVALSHPRLIASLFDVQQAAGFFQVSLEHNLLVMADIRTGLLEQNEIAFHEYVHYLQRTSTGTVLPSWYMEGLAEVFSTIRFEQDAAVVGNPPLSALVTLNNDGFTKPQRLLTPVSTTEIASNNRQRFYATAWLLAHYLFLSEEARAGAFGDGLTAYLKAVQDGATIKSALKTHLAMTPTQLGKQIRAYYRRGLPVFGMRLALDLDKEIVSRPLEEAEAALMLAEVTWANRPKLGRRLFKKAARHSRYQQRALIGVAQTQLRDKKVDLALSTLSPLVADESAAPKALLTYGRGLLRQCAGDDSGSCRDATVVEKALSFYSRAHSAASDQFYINFEYGRVLASAGQYAAAIPKLERAAALVPTFSETLRWLGYSHLRSGQFDVARRYLTAALARVVHDDAEREKIQVLLDQLEQRAG